MGGGVLFLTKSHCAQKTIETGTSTAPVSHRQEVSLQRIPFGHRFLAVPEAIVSHHLQGPRAVHKQPACVREYDVGLEVLLGIELQCTGPERTGLLGTHGLTDFARPSAQGLA